MAKIFRKEVKKESLQGDTAKKFRKEVEGNSAWKGMDTKLMACSWMHKQKIADKTRGSLTVEAALVMPIFLYGILAFLYFIQIFTVQEHIQEVITKKGLNIAKTAYLYGDFTDWKEAQYFDHSLFEDDLDIDLSDLGRSAYSATLLKALTKKDLDIELINQSCILEGFDSGISFFDTEIMDEEDCVDIIVGYRIRLPIPYFGLDDMRMVQRVRLRGWTGHQVPAKYSVVEEETKTEDSIVYITDTGSVYHLRRECSHLSLSIKEIEGIPTIQRNNSGGKYHPCEACCKIQNDPKAIYYITSFGDRYHTSKSCSKLKRTIKEVPLSEVGGYSPCKRCGKKGG